VSIDVATTGDRGISIRGSMNRFIGNLRYARPLLTALLTALVGVTFGISSVGASVKPKGVAKNYSFPVLAKDASILKGQRIVHTGCIFQFDGITGPKNFLAEWTNLGYSEWDNLVNVNLPSAAVGAHAFEKDVVTIRGYILGNYTYTNQDGGSDTVPNLEVVSVTVIGHNCN
jgi:hypothetical protein